MSVRTPGFVSIALLVSAACGDTGSPGDFSSRPLPTASPPADPGIDGGTSAMPIGTEGDPAGSASGGSSSGTVTSGSSSGGAPASGSSGGALAGGSSSSGGTSSVGSGSGIGTPSGGDGGVPPPRVTLDAFTGAPAFASKTGNSPHNPGQSCMKSGCHGPGGGETPFLIGGTVYKDYKGTIPAPGVEIRVRDMAGNAVSVYSGTNGNFYINASNSIKLPALVGARDGTTTRPMVTTLTSMGATTMGSCASAGCHIVGGSPSMAAYYPIHVP